MNGARLLLGGLFDDTAFFPPAGLPLPDAVARHADHRRGPAGWMLGRLVVPIDALAALEPLVADQAADAFGRPWGLSVIGSGNVEEDRQTLAAFRARHQGEGYRLVIESLEVPVATRLEVRRVRVLASDGWDVYCEPTAELDPLLDAIALAGVRAKLRAGARVEVAAGETTAGETTPPAAEFLARMLAGCVQRGIGMKATAGLQRACAAEGRHGYLNLLVAAGVAEAAGAAAVRAPDVIATLARILQLTTRPVLTPGGILEWCDDGGPRTEGPLHEIAPSARALLRGIGTSAFDTSVTDARALGLL